MKHVVMDTTALGEWFNSIQAEETPEPMFDLPFAYRLQPPLTKREALLIRAAYLAGMSAGDKHP